MPLKRKCPGCGRWTQRTVRCLACDPVPKRRDPALSFTVGVERMGRIAAQAACIGISKAEFVRRAVDDALSAGGPRHRAVTVSDRQRREMGKRTRAGA